MFLYLVNAAVRCLLHIVANIFMRDLFSGYSGGAGVLFNASSEHSEIFIFVFYPNWLIIRKFYLNLPLHIRVLLVEFCDTKISENSGMTKS